MNTLEIPKEKWADFLNDLSRRRFGWEAKVEVLSPDVGDQLLAGGLPLNGVTLEEKDGAASIDISVGETPDQHQTHRLAEPVAVRFLLADRPEGAGTLEIEDAAGTKTLLTLSSPMPVYVGYASYQVAIASS